MKAVAKFHKVSYEQFKAGMSDFSYTEDQLSAMYEGIKLPHRATAFSAG